MNLVDSSAWLEYFAGTRNAELVADAVEAVDQLLVPSVVVLEVTRRVMRQRGEDAALQVAAVMHQGTIVPLDGALALGAAQLGVARTLSLVDSIIYASARQFGATIWTFDAEFEDLPNVKYFRKSP